MAILSSGSSEGFACSVPPSRGNLSYFACDLKRFYFSLNDLVFRLPKLHTIQALFYSTLPNSSAKMNFPKSKDTKPRAKREFSSPHDFWQKSNKLEGKTILITGGTSGLGAESAVALARHGAKRIYITGRGQNSMPGGPPAGAQAVIEQVRQEYEEYKRKSHEAAKELPISKQTEIVFLQMDLSSPSSVSGATDKILSGDDSAPRLDILLCNAGIAAVPYSTTTTTTRTGHDGQEELRGYEIQFATNYLGHALLIRKLLPLLKQSPDGGRIISVSSFGFRLAGLVPGFGLFELFNGFRLPVSTTQNKWIACDSFGLGSLTRWLRYAESKLAMVIHTRELATRYPEVISVCVTPGFVDTGMVRGMGFCDRLGTRLLAGVTWAFGIEEEGSKGMVGPAEGAENQVWACLVEKEKLKNGGLYDPVGTLWEEERLSDSAKNEDLGERLWVWTEAALGTWV